MIPLSVQQQTEALTLLSEISSLYQQTYKLCLPSAVDLRIGLIFLEGMLKGATNSELELCSEDLIKKLTDCFSELIQQAKANYLAYPEIKSYLSGIVDVCAYMIKEAVESKRKSLIVRKCVSFLAYMSEALHIEESILDNRTIYVDEYIVLFYGKWQLKKEKPELGIAVKDVRGFWTYFPQKNNQQIPLSSFKKAKKSVTMWRGESFEGRIYHGQGIKLSKLLGLAVEPKKLSFKDFVYYRTFYKDWRGIELNSMQNFWFVGVLPSCTKTKAKGFAKIS